MTRCHICSTDTVDAHEPTLCAACCEDRVHRIVTDLAALSIRDAAEIADRLDAVPGDVTRLALLAGRSLR